MLARAFGVESLDAVADSVARAGMMHAGLDGRVEWPCRCAPVPIIEGGPAISPDPSQPGPGALPGSGANKESR